jgi:hypothetical protein
MEKEVELVKKVKRLLGRLKCPRWLHHFGPKTYEFYEHLIALLIRHYCKKISYRRVVRLFELFGMRCPSKSALQYTAKKMPKWIWDKALKETSGDEPYIAALDSTGLSRTNPSYHYLKRIDGKIPKIPIKLSVAFNTKKKKFCAANIRVLPAHDIRDAPQLMKRVKAKIIVCDKAYNAEKLYRLADQQGTVLMSPDKKNAKKGFFRKKMKKLFRKRTYNRRSLVEGGFSSIKRKFGHSVSSKRVKTIRADVYGMLLCHNLFQRLLLTFRTEPVFSYWSS